MSSSGVCAYVCDVFRESHHTSYERRRNVEARKRWVGATFVNPSEGSLGSRVFEVMQGRFLVVVDDLLCRQGTVWACKTVKRLLLSCECGIGSVNGFKRWWGVQGGSECPRNLERVPLVVFVRWAAVLGLPERPFRVTRPWVMEH